MDRFKKCDRNYANKIMLDKNNTKVTLLTREVISPGVKPSYTPAKMGMAMMM